MADLTRFETLIGQAINDPSHDEVGTGAGSVMLDWINRVLNDATKITDCLQTTVAVTGTGAAESFTLPTGGVSYIEILDYAALAGCVIVVTVNGNITTITEGVGGDWAIGGTNTATATNLTTVLNSDVTGITATSSGAVVTVTADATYTLNSLTADSLATDLFIDNSLVWHVINVVNPTSGIIYEPVPRDEYQDLRASIITNSVGGQYVYNVFGYGTQRKVFLIPFVALAADIDIDVSITHPVMVYVDGTEKPLGLLNEYDDLVIRGVTTIYYGINGDFERAQMEFAQYMDNMKRLAIEIGTNPVILPELSSLYQFINSKMKELRGV